MRPWFFVLVAAIVTLWVVLEGRRQQKKYGRASGRPNLAGVGMLELQKHLQPDRDPAKLELVMKKEGEVKAAQRAGDGPGA